MPANGAAPPPGAPQQTSAGEGKESLPAGALYTPPDQGHLAEGKRLKEEEEKKKKEGANKEKKDSGKVLTPEEEARQKEIKDLTPTAENLKKYTFGIYVGEGQEAVDMGGDKKLEDAFNWGLTWEHQINLDRELYKRLDTIYETFLASERQAVGKAGEKVTYVDERLKSLPPGLRAGFEFYKELRERMLKIEEINAEEAKKHRWFRSRQPNPLRVFQSGYEFQQGLHILEEAEIIAAHAFGQNITNGGRDHLSFSLSPHFVDFLERGEIGNYNNVGANLPGVLGGGRIGVDIPVRYSTQILHQIAEALHLEDPNERARILTVALSSIAVGGGIGAVGGFVGVLAGGGELGAAIAATIGAGSAGTISLGMGEVIIGNWALRFAGSRPGSPVNFTMRYINNLPAGDPNGRFAESELGKLFLGRGDLGGPVGPAQVRTNSVGSDFLMMAEKTRHSIYARLGLKIGVNPELMANLFDFNNLNTTQRDFIERVLHVQMRRGFGQRVFSAAEQRQIRAAAFNWSVGDDLWQIDLAPGNLSTHAGRRRGYHEFVKEAAQKIIRDRVRGEGFGPTQLANEVNYYNLDSLPIEDPIERARLQHRIMLEAYDQAAADVFDGKAREVLLGIAKGGVKDLSGTIKGKAVKVLNGEIPLEQEIVTDEEKREGRLRIAQAQDKVDTLTNLGKDIVVTDEELKKQQPARDEEEKAYEGVLTEHGEAERGTGIIGQANREIERINEQIRTSQDELGEAGYNPGTKTYPANSVLAEISRLSAEIESMSPNEAKYQDTLSAKRGARRKIEQKSEDQQDKTELAELNRVIKLTEDYLGKLKDNRTSLRNQETRRDQLKASIKEQEEARKRENAKIDTSKAAIATAKGKLDSAQRKVDSLEKKKKDLIAKIKELSEYEGEYGTGVHQELLAGAQSELEKLRKDLLERGVVEEEVEVHKKGAGGEDIVEKQRVKHPNKRTKEIGDGMLLTGEKIIETRFNDVVEKFWAGKAEPGIRDRVSSYETLVSEIFGGDLTPEQRVLAHRILSRKLIVDVLFEHLGIDNEVRARTFFGNDEEGFTAWQTSRANIARINTINERVGELRGGQAPSDWENQIRILTEELHRLENINVRALHTIYEGRAVGFWSEHRHTQAEFVRKLLVKIRENADNFNPFAESVQFPETLGPNDNVDGLTTPRGPRVDPVDGRPINRGGNTWQAPRENNVNGQPVSANVGLTFTNEGAVRLQVTANVQNVTGLLAVIPPTLGAPGRAARDTDLPADSLVARELEENNLLNDVYDPADGVRRAGVEQVVASIRVRLDLPEARPPENLPYPPAITNFLAEFGLDRSVLNDIYNTAPAVPGGPTRISNDILDAIIQSQINRRVANEVTLGLEMETPGDGDPVAQVEAWMAEGSRFQLGQTERMFRSFGRALADQSPETNRDLLGDRFERVTNITAEMTYEVVHNNGNLYFIYTPVDGVPNTLSLREVLTMENRADTLPGLTDDLLNDLLFSLGENALDAMRRRTP